MANLLSLLRRRSNEITRYNVNDYLRQITQGFGSGFSYYPSPGPNGRTIEKIENDFPGYTYSAYKADPVVFGCMITRSSVFSETRFTYRRLDPDRENVPGGLFGGPGLSVLDRPWPNGTTGELLVRALQDADLAGNFFVTSEQDRLRRLRPDWTYIVLDGNPLEDAEVNVVGYMYCPGGVLDYNKATYYLPDQVAHWSPIPDPTACYRGMSWLTPVIREIQGDQAATNHKLAFFNNGAVLGPIVKADPKLTPTQFKEFIAASEAAHAGVDNAYKTMYIGGGADITLGMADFRQLDLKSVQGGYETRICVAAQVPAAIAGVSEGLAGSSLNAGNYTASRRRFADATMRPLWRSICAALAPIIDVPDDAELWYDSRDVAFLQDDAEQRAQITKEQILALESGIRGGYKPDALVDAITTGDVSLLKGQHSNLYSVQLQPAGPDPNNPAAAPKLDLTRPGQTPELAAEPEPFTTRAYVGYDLPDEELERAGYRPDQPRFGKAIYLGKIPVAGRWRRLGGTGGVHKIFEALDTYLRGEGPEKPLAGFRVPQLRRAAITMHISHHGAREELSGRILDNARMKVIGHRQALRDLPRYSYGKGVDRPQVKDRDGRLRDIEIHQDERGLSIAMLDDNNRPMGVAVGGLKDWRDVHGWAKKNNHPTLAGWVQKYHPTTRYNAMRRKQRVEDVLDRLRSYPTFAEAELLLHGLEPAELADLYRWLGGDIQNLPRGPNGRIPNQVLIDAILAGWPKFRGVGPLAPGGDPMATHAHGSGIDIGDSETGGVYGSPGEWGAAGYSVGGGGDIPLDELG